MPKRRLLWQIYPFNIFITLSALLAVGWFASHAFEQFYTELVRHDLEQAARLLERQIGDQIPVDRGGPVATLCRQLGQTTGARLAVILPSGAVACDSQETESEPENRRDRPDVQQALAGNVSSSTRYYPALEQRLTQVALPVIRGEKTVGAIYASLPLDVVDQQWGELQRRILVVGVLVAALAALFSLVVSLRISRPLEEMRHGAERLARGELGHKLLVPESGDLASLAEALNQMAEQLQERISTIVRQSNEQQAVLASMDEGVLAVDNQERIISFNTAFAHLLDIDPVPARGTSLQEVVRNADLRRFVTRALAERQAIEDDVVLHSSEQRVLEARSATLHDDQGRAVGAVVVLNDVTNFRRLEDMRRDFVANVSHELKTPITSIKGFVETLLDGAIHNPTDADRFLRIVAKQADRLDAIIEDLLSLSKIEQGEEAANIALEPGPLQPVLEAAMHDCEAKCIERSIRVRLECPGELTARCNAALLEQAVINLLDNAIKYSEPGSEVQLCAALVEDEVTITISDRGCGIAAEHLARIFERFYRVDKARSRKLGGTGLGLAIVKHIAQAHGGRVSVKSILGVGSTFTLHLPKP